MITMVDSVRVMAGNAIEVTALQKKHKSVTGTVDTGKSQDFTDYSFFIEINRVGLNHQFT